MLKEFAPYKRLVLVCTNVKNDETKPCCGRKDGEAIFTNIREEIRSKNLSDVVRVSKTGCLGKCVNGPNIIVYPDGIWYSEVRLEDIKDIIGDITLGFEER